MNDTGALTIKAAHDDRTCVLTLSGDLDLLSTPEFLEQVVRVVHDRTERLVLDLAGLTFLDCGGARALVTASDFAPRGCLVITRSPSRAARLLFGLLNLDLGHLWQELGAGPEDRGMLVRRARAVRATV
jgi:anti-anti-sigma factor